MSYRVSNASGLYREPQPGKLAVTTDTATVPADGHSVVYLLNLGLGCRVIVDGPDPDAFDVSDDTVALAFVVPGRYVITVASLDGSIVRMDIEATHPYNVPQDWAWMAPPILPCQLARPKN